MGSAGMGMHGPAKKGKVELDGKEVSYNKGGMRENLTEQGKIKSGGKITKQIWKNAEEGDYGSLAEKQANFSKNAFGFTGTSMRGPSQRIDPPKKTTKPKIDPNSSTPVSKQIEYFNYLKKNNLQDTHKSRENYSPKK